MCYWLSEDYFTSTLRNQDRECELAPTSAERVYPKPQVVNHVLEEEDEPEPVLLASGNILDQVFKQLNLPENVYIY